MLASMSCSGTAGGARELGEERPTDRDWKELGFHSEGLGSLCLPDSGSGPHQSGEIGSSLGIMAEVALPPGAQAVPHVNAAHGALLCLPQPCPRASRTAR